jgi:hypothetical protein
MQSLSGFSATVKTALEMAAAGDDRSAAWYVEKVLADHPRAKGYLPDQAQSAKGKNADDQ